jgi:hypothetical protein
MAVRDTWGVAEIFLKKGQTVVEVKNKTGRWHYKMALHRTSTREHEVTVRLLLENEAETGATSRNTGRRHDKWSSEGMRRHCIMQLREGTGG